MNVPSMGLESVEIGAYNCTSQGSSIQGQPQRMNEDPEKTLTVSDPILLPRYLPYPNHIPL